jgi:hypothetical protein
MISSNLAVLGGWTELPLLKSTENKLRLREPLRKDDGQPLKLAPGIDKTVNHDGISVGVTRREVGPHDDIRPGCIRARDDSGGGSFLGRRQAILENPTPGEAHMKVDRVRKPLCPCA